MTSTEALRDKYRMFYFSEDYIFVKENRNTVGKVSKSQSQHLQETGCRGSDSVAQCVETLPPGFEVVGLILGSLWFMKLIWVEF